MFDVRRMGNASLAGATLLFACSILLFSLDFRPGCSCNDWEVCCKKDVRTCGEERCLCQDVLIDGEEPDADAAYCMNQTVTPSLSFAFWLGYICAVFFVLLLKAGIVFHVIACCQSHRVRTVAVVQGMPVSRMPGQKVGEKDSLLI